MIFVPIVKKVKKMKVKDLIEILLTLNPEAEIGPTVDVKPNKILEFYEETGWIEKKDEQI